MGLSFELAAITRVRDPYRRLIAAEVPIFESSDALFDSLEKGELALDAVIIATPHYSHEEIAVRTLRSF